MIKSIQIYFQWFNLFYHLFWYQLSLSGVSTRFWQHILCSLSICWAQKNGLIHLFIVSRHSLLWFICCPTVGSANNKYISLMRKRVQSCDLNVGSYWLQMSNLELFAPYIRCTGHSSNDLMLINIISLLIWHITRFQSKIRSQTRPHFHLYTLMWKSIWDIIFVK